LNRFNWICIERFVDFEKQTRPVGDEPLLAICFNALLMSDYTHREIIDFGQQDWQVMNHRDLLKVSGKFLLGFCVKFIGNV
jgi:hypothetical protein